MSPCEPDRTPDLRAAWQCIERRMEPEVRLAAATRFTARFLAEVGGRQPDRWLHAGDYGCGPRPPAVPGGPDRPPSAPLPAGSAALVLLPGVVPLPGLLAPELSALESSWRVPSVTAATGTFRTPEENLPAVEAALRDAADRGERLVVLGYSQGAMNGLAALDRLTRRGDPLAGRVAAFVALCGAHHGSPLAETLERLPHWFDLVPAPVRDVLGTEGNGPAELLDGLRSLSRTEAAQFWADPDLALPVHTTWVSLGVISRRRDVPALQKLCYDLVRRSGPNDMQVVWRDTWLGTPDGALAARRLAAVSVTAPPFARTHHWLPVAAAQLPFVEADTLRFPRLALLRAVVGVLADLGVLDA